MKLAGTEDDTALFWDYLQTKIAPFLEDLFCGIQDSSSKLINPPKTQMCGRLWQTSANLYQRGRLPLSLQNNLCYWKGLLGNCLWYCCNFSERFCGREVPYGRTQKRARSHERKIKFFKPRFPYWLIQSQQRKGCVWQECLKACSAYLFHLVVSPKNSFLQSKNTFW